MADSDPGQTVFPHRAGEESVASLSCGLFQVASGREGGLFEETREAEAGGKVLDEPGILVAFGAAEAVIEVKDGERERWRERVAEAERLLEEEVEKGNGISASGHRDTKRLSWLEHVITKDGFGDALEQRPLRIFIVSPHQEPSWKQISHSSAWP
jgi:hypothetical protein